MNSVPRKLTIGLILAIGAAACGDDVTVSNPPTVTPVVHSVTVSPSSATVAQGGSFQFGAAIEADAGVTRTVTWSAAGGTGITVSNSGLASASATATGTASICAASDAAGFTDVKSCSSLTVAAPSAAATVQIGQTTVACALINTNNPGFTGCGLGVPVSINNTYGQIDVTTNVSRPPNSGVRTVRLEVFGVNAAGVTNPTSEFKQDQTLTGDFVSEDATLAAQTTTSPIVFSINTAAYSLNAAGTVATVTHPNGIKRLRVTLLDAAGNPLTTNATAETQLSFRNANGFHITMNTNLNSGNNANTTCGALGATACPIRVNALAGPTGGLAYNGGTPLDITAVPVVYATGALHPNGFTGVLAQAAGTGIGFGSAACDLTPAGFGGGARILGNLAPTNAGATIRGTLAYTNVKPTATTPAPVGTVTGYEMSPVCAAAALGEVPFAVGVDASGNPLLNFGLGGPYAPFNTLNNPFAPVMGDAIGPNNVPFNTAPAVRLDNSGPAPIFGYATGRNDVGTGGIGGPDACFGLWLNGPQTTHGGFGCAAPPAALLVGTPGVPANATPQASFVFGRTARLNGWTNPTVAFNALSATQVTAAALATVATAAQNVDGAVAPSANATGLPLDAGVGNGVVGGNQSTLIGRVGTFGTGGTCNTVAQCSTAPVRATAAGLTETNTGFALGAIVQSVDPFGNLTNPPAPGAPGVGATNNFGTIACPAALAPALCLANPLDPNNPYVVGGVLRIGFDQTTPTIASRGGPSAPGALNTGTNIVGTTFTNNTIQGVSTADFDYQADDVVPTGLTGTSGILTVAPGSDLYVSLSRRDGATTQYFCPTSANYQPVGNTCPNQIGWAPDGKSGVAGAPNSTFYNRGAGRIFTDPAASLVRAYYQAIVFSRDQAGNQTVVGTAATVGSITASTRDFIFDNTPPNSFGASFSPGIFPAGAALTFTGTASEDLDVGRGAISVRFPSLNSVAGAVGADFIRLPWTNRNATGQLANPIGYLAPGPSTPAILSSTWAAAIRSIEVVTPGDNAVGPLLCGPVATPGNGGFNCPPTQPVTGIAAGGINFPGGLNGGGVPIAYVQDGNLAGGAGPTQFNWFAQSVSRVGLLANPPAGPQGTVPAGAATAIAYGQSGMLGTAHPCGGALGAAGGNAWWTATQACGAAPGGVANPFFNMQWALLNPSQATALDLNGSTAANASKTITAIAFGANGTIQSPFLGGVHFYAVDIRQPLNIDANFLVPPVGTGIALVEICTVGITPAVGSGQSIVNDQATNTWQYSCVYNPSAGAATSVLQTNDLAGFNLPSSTNQMVNYVAGVPTANGAAVPNSGFWGNGQISGATGFNQGWQGNAGVAAIGAANMPVIAVGCNTLGNCLSTRVSTNAGFNVTP